MTVTALAGIAESGDEAAFSSPWWFDPFGLNNDRVFEELLPKAMREGRPGVSCGANHTFVPFPLPVGEPEARLFTWPAPRCGVVLVGVPGPAAMRLARFWPFVTEGIQHTLKIERVLLPPDRLEGVIEGTVGDAIALAWNDVFFPLDRGYYAQGSVHEVLLAGLAHEIDIGSDGAIELNTRTPAAIVPGSSSAPAVHSIRGPVKSIEPYRYSGELLGRKMWEMRVTAARIADAAEPDFDLLVFVTDLVLKGRPPPKVGEIVRSLVRLQGRIWHPNVQPGS